MTRTVLVCILAILAIGVFAYTIGVHTIGVHTTGVHTTGVHTKRDTYEPPPQIPRQDPDQSTPLDLETRPVSPRSGYSSHARVYDSLPGPIVGEPLGVPVPATSLKTLPPWYREVASPVAPAGPFQPLTPYFGTTPPIVAAWPTPLNIPVHNSFGRDVYSRPETRLVGGGIPPDSRIYGGPTTTVPVVVASVYPQAPLPSLTRGLYQVGVLATTKGDGLLNLYARPIAPGQDLWQYAVQDKNGMTVYLDNVRELEDGDTIHSVTGKASQGPWKVTLYDKNRWVQV
jgi:hypothetical protein